MLAQKKIKVIFIGNLNISSLLTFCLNFPPLKHYSMDSGKESRNPSLCTLHLAPLYFPWLCCFGGMICLTAHLSCSSGSFCGNSVCDSLFMGTYWEPDICPVLSGLKMGVCRSTQLPHVSATGERNLVGRWLGLSTEMNTGLALVGNNLFAPQSPQTSCSLP